MADDSSIGIFFVGTDRATIHAAGVFAMMAGSCDRLLVGGGIFTTEESADIAPGFALIEAVERGASGHACLATRAAVEGNLEGVLLTFAGLGKRDERAVMRGEIWLRMHVSPRTLRRGSGVWIADPVARRLDFSQTLIFKL